MLGGVQGDGDGEDRTVHVGGTEVHPTQTAPRPVRRAHRRNRVKWHIASASTLYTLKGIRSGPKNTASVVIRAAVPQACPEEYSVKGGVTSRGIHAGRGPGPRSC
jgi:hypothetical protein